MRIKHSKYKNTGLIFELLVKQIAADTLNKKESPAINILKKFYTGTTPLVKEFKLYEALTKHHNTSQSKAEHIISAILEVSRRINEDKLKSLKYKLIKEIRDNYDLEEFFTIKVKNYKSLAALYCLLEAHRVKDVIDPNFIVNNKATILEHLTTNEQDKEEIRDSLIEEYATYDKDLKLLTFKILLENFNNKYSTLLPEQKNILREFIVSVDSSAKLRNVVNEELDKLKTQIETLQGKVKDDIVKIKLNEILKNIQPVPKTKRVTDDHLVNIMQHYELVKELRKV